MGGKWGFWTKPDVMALLNSSTPPRDLIDKLQALAPTGMTITLSKIYRARYTTAHKPKGHHAKTGTRSHSSYGIRDRKLALAYEVLGLEVREEVERQKALNTELEQKIRDLEQLINQANSRIRELEKDVLTSEEFLKKRALDVAGVRHGD